MPAKDCPNRHVCSCQSSIPSIGGVVLKGSSVMVDQLIEQAIGDDLPGTAGVGVVGAGFAERVRKALATLTPYELRQVRAVPVDANGNFDPWISFDAESLMDRLDTPWFPGLLNQGRLRFVFQPIVHADESLKPLGYECLMRGYDHCREFGAGELIRAARGHDALLRLDQTARREAIMQGGPKLPNGAALFVNFLPTTIYDPAVCLRTTWHAAQATGLSLDRVVFEVVETEEFPRIDLLCDILRAYKDKGARVALDDTGAGHATMSMIDRLRPDFVKLDKGLLPDKPDSENMSIVRGVIEHAHALQIKVIAEGIETPEQLEAVRACGVDFVQGYLIARPTPEMVETAGQQCSYPPAKAA